MAKWSQTDGHKVSIVFIYLPGDLTTDRDQTQPCVLQKLASVISQLIRMIGQKKMLTHTKKPHRGNFVNLK